MCGCVRETGTRQNPSKLQGLRVEKSPLGLSFSNRKAACLHLQNSSRIYSALIYEGALQNQELKLGKIVAKSEIIG